MNEQKPQNSPINRHGVVPTPIGDLTLPVRSWSPGIEAPDEQLTYVDLSSISSEAKAIESPSELLGSEAPSRARQKIRGRDILVSTVRPNLNAVAWVTSEFDGATASTGFCVLRPNLEVVCDRYLYHWVRTPEFVGEMTKVATGASYPAVSDRIIKNSKIPLPPSLVEQKRLAAILDQADAIRRKRQQALRLTDDFLRSVFLDFFGDPVNNPKGWETCPLSDLIANGDTVNYGVIQPGTDHPGGIPLVRAGDVASANPDVSKLKHIDPEIDGNYERSRLRGGEVLIGCVGAVGATCIAPKSWKGVNIARAVARIRLRPDIEAETLFQSLQHRAFTGQL